jgi:hypothetical protein
LQQAAALLAQLQAWLALVQRLLGPVCLLPLVLGLVLWLRLLALVLQMRYQQHLPLLVPLLLLLKLLAHCWSLPSMRSWRHPHSPTAVSRHHTSLQAPLASPHMTGLHPTVLPPPPPPPQLLLLLWHLPG